MVSVSPMRRDTIQSAQGKMDDSRSMYMKQISNTRSNRGGAPISMIQVDRISQPRGSGANSIATIRRANFKAASSVSMEMQQPFGDYMSNAGGAQLNQNQEQINRNVRAMKRMINDQKKEEKEKDKKARTSKVSPPKVKESSTKLKKKKTENPFFSQVQRKQNMTKKLSRSKSIRGGAQKDGKGEDGRRQSLTSVFTHKSKGQHHSSINTGSSEEDEESQFQNLKRRIGRSKCTIYPDSKLKDAWDWIACVFILYEAVTIPVMVAFRNYNIYMLQIEIAIEAFFFADMFIQFVTGYYDKGVLIMNRKQIAKRYFKQTLFFDATANVPMHTMMTFESYIPLSISIDMLNVFRLVKLLRIYKMGFFGQKIFDYIVSDFLNLIVNFVTMMANILVIAHWSACLFCYSGTVNTSQRTWILEAHLSDATDTEKYINAMYFSITTMATIGYGDIRPFNTGEFIVVIFLELVAGIAFAYMIGKIGSLFQRYNLLAETYGEKVQFVLQFLTLRNIPKDLRMKIKRYLDYNFEMKKDLKIEEEEVYSFLNDDLKSRITVFMNGKILQSVSVFSEFPLDFLSNLTFILGKKNFAMEEYVFNEGDDGKDIYFITQGKVCLIHRQSYTYIIDLEKEQSFGEIGFFTDCQRQVTVKSRDYTDCLTVNLIEFLNIAQTYSEISISIFHKISGAIDTWKKDFSPLKIKCYICSSSKHISIDCPMFKSKMRGNIAHIIKQQSKKDLYGNLTSKSGEASPRAPQRHRSTIRMPVVSPALSREITMKVRDELGASNKLGNWRSIINLQPIGIEQLGEDLGDNPNYNGIFDSQEEMEHRKRMSMLLKGKLKIGEGGNRISGSNKIPYHQSSKDGRFDMISEKRLAHHNEEYSDHRSFSSDSSFEDYSNQDSNKEDLELKDNSNQNYEAQNLDEDEEESENKMYYGAIARPKVSGNEGNLEQMGGHIHLQHLQGNMTDPMMNNDILQLDEIEEIKEESGESIYSEMDNFSRRKRRGTLLGIEQNRLMMVNQMKKSSRKLISQNNLGVASTASLQKSQTQLTQALQPAQNRVLLNEKRHSNQVHIEKLKFNSTPGKGDYQTQISLQQFQPISPLPVRPQTQQKIPQQSSFRASKEVKSLKNHLMEMTRRVSNTLMRAVETENRENSTSPAARSFFPQPQSTERVNEMRPQTTSTQQQKTIHSIKSNKHSTHRMDPSIEEMMPCNQGIKNHNSRGGRDKIPDFGHNQFFELEGEEFDDDGSSTMSKVKQRQPEFVIPQSRIAMAIKPIAGIKQNMGKRNLAKALQKHESNELSALDGFMTYRRDEESEVHRVQRPHNNNRSPDQGKTKRSFKNTFSQNFSDDSSINSQLFYLPQNKNSKMLQNAQSLKKQNKQVSLDIQNDQNYYPHPQSPYSRDITIASPYNSSRKGTSQQPQEMRSSTKSPPLKNQTYRAQSSIGSLTKRSQRKTITVIRPTEEIEEEDEKYDYERQNDSREEQQNLDDMEFENHYSSRHEGQHHQDDSISRPDFDLDHGSSSQLGQERHQEEIRSSNSKRGSSLSMSINGRARTGSQNSKKTHRVLEFQMEQKKIERDSQQQCNQGSSISARGTHQPETNVEFNFQNFVNFKITMADLDGDEDDASSIRSQSLFPSGNIQSNTPTQVPNSVNGEASNPGPIVQGSHEVIVDNISYKFNYQAK